MDYKTLIGAAAVAIGFIGYVPYFRDIFANKTKPHAFSWLIWSVLSGIAFAGQLSTGGGAGAWVNGLAAAACFSIFLLALMKGTKEFPLVDWLALGGAGVGLVMWAITKNPTLTIVIVTIIDLLGFVPTIRKSIAHPEQETMSLYALNIAKYSLGIIALREYSVATVLFTAAGAVEGAIVVMLLLIRRAQTNN